MHHSEYDASLSAASGIVGPVPAADFTPRELRAAIVLFASLLDERQRRLYAGRESLKCGWAAGDRPWKENRAVIATIEAALRHDVAGDPITGTRRTTEKIARELGTLNIQVCPRTVAASSRILTTGSTMSAPTAASWPSAPPTTPHFVADNLVRWWQREGLEHYCDTSEPLARTR